jgi:hypothetical protein
MLALGAYVSVLHTEALGVARLCIAGCRSPSLDAE